MSPHLSPASPRIDPRRAARTPLFVALLMTLSAHTQSAVAGSLIGPGTEQTLTAADPVESWNVRNGAHLILDGGQTTTIDLRDATLSGQGQTGNITALQGGSINLTNSDTGRIYLDGGSPGGTLFLDSSHVAGDNQAVVLLNSAAQIRSSDIRSDLNSALDLRYSAEGSATAEVSNSNISGRGFGATVGSGNTLRLAGTHIDGRPVPSPIPDFDNPGIAVLVTGGSIELTQGSVAASGGYGVVMRPASATAGGLLDSSLLVAGSTVGGDLHAGISVEDSLDRAASATIEIRNGSLVRSSSGRAIQVLGNSSASVNVVDSQLEGGLFAGEDASMKAELHRTDMTGAAVNVSELALEGSTWQMTGDSHVGDLSNNGSVIRLGDGVALNTLTVTGNYIGNGGTIEFNTVLAADSSLTDKLHIAGDTSGTTNIRVNNIGGAGAQTDQGIRIITVGGASNGQFDLAGRAVAGQYDYFLFKGADDGNWYLRSQMIPPTPTPCDNDPTLPECDTDGPGPGPGPDPIPVLRPEIGSYLANLQAAQSMFRHSYHDRHAAQGSGRTWLRFYGNRYGFVSQNNQLDIDATSRTAAAGVDLWRSENNSRIGLMVTTGSSSSKSVNHYTGYHARGRVRGTAIGAYGTWVSDPTQHGGSWYVDTSLQRLSVRNRVEGLALAPERYRTRGWETSIEVGYSMRFLETQTTGLRIEPQLQLSKGDWSQLNHVETNGTVLKSRGSDGQLLRVGTRFDGFRKNRRGSSIIPYLQLDWLKSGGASRIVADGEVFKARIPSSRFQTSIGGSLRVANGLAAQLGLAYQSGSRYHSSEVHLNVSYDW